MSTAQERIAQLENSAVKLINNLDSLYQKAGSYNAAKDELQKSNSELIQLIKETKTLGVESHKIISAINEIGSSQIFKNLEKIDRNLISFRDDSQNQSKSIKIFLIISIVLLLISIGLNALNY